MWFPWPESKTLENPVELNDSGDVQETVTIPPHFHRARLTYFSSVGLKSAKQTYREKNSGPSL